ncbi:MAG: DUF839 domain-containing protein [Saprospiraceae bacterium]
MKYLIFLLFCPTILLSQHISEFFSVEPTFQTTDFKFPATHTFQVLIAAGDPLTSGGTLNPNNDFTGYIPTVGNTRGVLGINAEMPTGSVAKLSVKFTSSVGWEVLSSTQSFLPEVGGTMTNCSGHVTGWGNLITCEENIIFDVNGDGYNDAGWCIEIDQATWKPVNYAGGLPNGDKIWQMGCMKHENVVIHSNGQTCYFGADSDPGYLYKYVADVAQNLGSGNLYVYKELTATTGEWVQLPNKTPYDQNRTIFLSDSVGAKVFQRVEDVEISPVDGKIYFAVTAEGVVYRMTDTPFGTTVSDLEIYFGGQNYDIFWGGGTTSVYGCIGADNLAFDDLGNLWVCQDGDNNYIWVVKQGHTQSTPDVEVFGIVPAGAEPTGMTFTPDYQYCFMSIQHPNTTNNATTQLDAFGVPEAFDNSVSLVIARTENLGNALPIELIKFTGKKVDSGIQLNWEIANAVNFSHFEIEKNGEAIGETVDDYFLDKSPNKGANYYRLKMVDLDGSFNWSKTINILFESSDLVISPNPNDGIFTVNSEEYQIFDFQGKEVFQPLLKGIYFIKAGNQMKKIVVLK